jgi:uncharacterized protein (TIGR02217 family)
MTAFHEVQFPTGISEGATGGPVFKTEIVATASGFEQRNQNWSKARGSWDIGTGIKSRTDFQDVLEFFYARKGRLHGFRFKDWADYSGTLEVLVAAAAGGETTAQLVKTYTDSGGSYIRTIYKPTSGSLSVYKNGSGTPLGGVTYSTVTGIVTFPSLTAADVLRATYEFDVPVRFEMDDLRLQLTKFDIGDVPSINLVELRLDSSGQG